MGLGLGLGTWVRVGDLVRVGVRVRVRVRVRVNTKLGKSTYAGDALYDEGPSARQEEQEDHHSMAVHDRGAPPALVFARSVAAGTPLVLCRLRTCNLLVQRTD